MSPRTAATAGGVTQEECSPMCSPGYTAPDYEVRDCGYETPCWVWLKSRYANGYGQYSRRDGYRGLAHRAYYQIHVGPIPDGFVLDHLCRNRACVNPDHLEPVARGENTRRGGNAAKTHCDHGHPLSGDNLYVDPRGRRQCKACRRQATAKSMQRYTPEAKRAMFRRYRETQKRKSVADSGEAGTESVAGATTRRAQSQ